MGFPHINPGTISGYSTAISSLAKALEGDIPRQEMEDNILEMPNPDACDFVSVINKFEGPRNVNTDNYILIRCAQTNIKYLYFTSSRYREDVCRKNTHFLARGWFSCIPLLQ